eukprot:8603767-Pyramimonas_sp.AAC.2
MFFYVGCVARRGRCVTEEALPGGASWQYCTVPRCSAQECSPTGFAPEYGFSSCYKFSDADALNLTKSHVADVTASASPYVPGDLEKVRVCYS